MTVCYLFWMLMAELSLRILGLSSFNCAEIHSHGLILVNRSLVDAHFLKNLIALYMSFFDLIHFVSPIKLYNRLEVCFIFC